MTPKERAAMQQALEALHNTQNALLFVSGSIQQFIISNMTADAHDDADKAITALREALAKEIIELHKQAEQEPVGHVLPDGTICWDRWCPDAGTLLYTHPVRTKDLTDDELAKAAGFHELLPQELYIARAVIAAYKEKNK